MLEPNDVLAEIQRRAALPRFTSVAELTAALRGLPDSEPWHEQVKRAIELFQRATPWPGTVAELEAAVDSTLARAGVPAPRRPMARLALLPAY